MRLLIAVLYLTLLVIYKATALSFSEEQAIGQLLLNELNSQQLLSKDLITETYIHSIVKKLNSKPFNSFVVADKEINACAFFGDNIAIHQGLIGKTQHESELAAVLAHEISHLEQRHLQRALEQANTNNKLRLATLAGSILAGMASPDAAMGLMQFGLTAIQEKTFHYSREQEKEADRFGIKLLQQAGFNPAGMSNMLKILQKAQRLQGGIKGLEYLRTHPINEERIADSDNRTHKLLAPEQDSLDYQFIMARLKAYTNSEYKITNNLVNNFYQALLSAKTNPQQGYRLLEEIYATNPNWIIAASMLEHKVDSVFLEKAYNLDRNFYPLAFLYANQAYKNQNYAKSILILERLKRSYPNNLTIYNILAQAYNKQGNLIKMRENQAQIYFLQNDLEKAKQQLIIALETIHDEFIGEKIKKQLQAIEEYEKIIKSLIG